MGTPQKLTLTKLQAAKRQLETAIYLWINDGDPVSVHTLAAAGGHLVSDLSDGTEFKPILFDPKVLPKDADAAKAIKKLICKAENFFKHADKNGGDVLVFNTVQTEGYLFAMAHCYLRMTSDRAPLLLIFATHYMFHHPQYWDGTDALKLAGESFPVEALKGLSKKEFFECFLGRLGPNYD